MSKEKKNQELSDEELQKASGGGLTPLGGHQQATPESRMEGYTQQRQDPLGPPDVIEDPGPDTTRLGSL